MSDRHNRTRTMTMAQLAVRLECGLATAKTLIVSGKGPGIALSTGGYYIRIEWVEKFERGEPFFIGPNPSLDAQPIKKHQRVSPFRLVERKSA